MSKRYLKYETEDNNPTIQNGVIKNKRKKIAIIGDEFLLPNEFVKKTWPEYYAEMTGHEVIILAEKNAGFRTDSPCTYESLIKKIPDDVDAIIIFGSDSDADQLANDLDYDTLIVETPRGFYDAFDLLNTEFSGHSTFKNIMTTMLLLSQKYSMASVWFMFNPTIICQCIYDTAITNYRSGILPYQSPCGMYYGSFEITPDKSLKNRIYTQKSFYDDTIAEVALYIGDIHAYPPLLIDFCTDAVTLLNTDLFFIKNDAGYHFTEKMHEYIAKSILVGLY